MAKKYFLGLDNGTTGTTALLLDENWQQVGRGYKEVSAFYPRDGWMEQDAEEIWDSILYATKAACDVAGIKATDIACLGIDNVGETVVMWDKISGRPVYNAIVWQDRRTSHICDEMQGKWGEFVKERAGVMIDSYFSATKIKWLLDNVTVAKELAAQGRLLTGTMDGWLFWKLTRGKVFATDASTASRTMLMNYRTGKWDTDLLDLFGVNVDMLPAICDNAHLFGHTDPNVFFGARIPISGGIVDQQSSLFGQACFEPGMTKCTYGTGCFMLMNTGNKPIASPNGLITTVAWQLDGKLCYALDGGIYVAGAATQWLRDKLGIIKSASETEKMALDAGTNGGVFFVPAFSGLAAPHWDSYARGTMIGITGGTTKEQIVRATLEATAYQVRDNLEAMNHDSGFTIRRLRVDGGAVANNFLMQFQADIAGVPVDVPLISETTALGAAYLAALATGEFKFVTEIAANWKMARSFEPRMSEDERQYLMHKWHMAVERAKAWAG